MPLGPSPIWCWNVNLTFRFHQRPQISRNQLTNTFKASQFLDVGNIGHLKWWFIHVVYNNYHYNYRRMPNDQEMKLKNQRHLNSSLDKSLRPPVPFHSYRKKKKPAKSAPGFWESSCSSSWAPRSSRSWTQPLLPQTIYLSDLYIHEDSATLYPIINSMPYPNTIKHLQFPNITSCKRRY